MKKAALVLALLFVVLMPLNVSAASRLTTINPSLGFDGTTAKCDVVVLGNKTSDYIEVTMKLMNGSSCIAMWTDDGYGYVHINERASVAKNVTYTLVVEVKINNVALTPVSVSEKC